MARIVKEADERRNEILDAAETLFTEKGYSKTTIIDILNQVGIAKGTFYYYFKSKEEVMDAIIERFIEQDVQKARLIATLLVEAPHGEALLLRRKLRQGHLARVVPLRARFLDRHQVHAERRVGRRRQEDADGVRAPFGEGTRRRIVDVIERFCGGPDLADRFRGRFVRLAEGAGYGRKRDVRFDGNVFYGRPGVIETVFIHFIVSFQCIIHLFCTSMSTFSI